MDEESDIEDRVASELSEDSNQDLDDYDSDESGSEDANYLLDMEAAESEGEYDDTSSTAEQFYFPQFKSLPPELRAHIWEFFDPDLRAKARVFYMIVRRSPIEFWRSATLIEQTAPARAMLATHRESRALALKSYPDTIGIHRGTGIIRYNSERDVILVSIGSVLRPNDLEEFVSSLGATKNLGFEYLREANEEILHSRLASHPTLKAVFRCYDSHDYSSRELRWCASDSVHRFYTLQTENDMILGSQPLKSMYCWPDLEDHREFAEEHAQTIVEHPKPFTIWTMIEFSFSEGLRRYERLKAAALSSEEWGSDEESEHDSIFLDDDMYESEGIDDATIESDSASDEENDDLVVQSGSDEDDMSVFNGFSPIQDENPELYLGDGIEVGSFSSLEPESPSHHDDASESDLSDEEPVQKSARRKRRIVSSDDEDEPDDKDDEEVKPLSRPAKRSRIVLSDTEDEDDEGTDEDTKQDRDVVYESEESDESEDEEPVKTKSMSLFEKLKQYRQENPISSNSDAGSDIEASIGSEDWDGSNNDTFPDDEVEDEDELRENGGQLTDISEEHLDEDEDEEDGW
ncbi:hypothetical protein F4774DRAFT_365939 [Daldinia eschscholtzii]|nr:hypothetical protein F4774DRAFT_365939 [Daldinia eschscholtzii]